MHRVVSIGGKGRFLACEDPGIQTHLPVATAAWVRATLATRESYLTLLLG